MAATLKNLAATAVLLPPKDRTYLAERLLASLEDSEIEQQWRSEAKRRRDEVRSGRVKPIPAEEVYRRIERLLSRQISPAHFRPIQ
jgi:putative addiction module component (TIGR02574 family)